MINQRRAGKYNLTRTSTRGWDHRLEETDFSREWRDQIAVGLSHFGRRHKLEARDLPTHSSVVDLSSSHPGPQDLVLKQITRRRDQLKRHAAINEYGLAADIRGQWRGQEEHAASDFFWFASAAERDGA